jgi:hypothetical protein
MSERVVREKDGVVMVRSSTGQVTEYDVYKVVDGKRVYVGGGTKREGQRLFDKTKGER